MTELDSETGAIFARNAYTSDYPGRIGFSALSERPTSATADRLEFLGRHGTMARPAALERRGLGERFGAGLDPCAALHLVVELGPGERRSITHVLGQARHRVEARDLLRRHRGSDRAREAGREVAGRWDATLGTVEVHTPDDSFDLLMNRWLFTRPFPAACGLARGIPSPGAPTASGINFRM